jgi:hypothetical protein
LRQTYLKVYISERDDRQHKCRPALEKLGARVRDGLSKRETAQIDTHLDRCGACHAVAVELREELPA